MPSSGEKAAASRPAVRRAGDEPPGLDRVDETTGDAELFWSSMLRSNAATSSAGVRQEQVADPAEVDLGAGAGRRSARRPAGSRAPSWMLRGSENCARTPPAALLVDPEASSSRSTRSTSRDAGLGEVEGD